MQCCSGAELGTPCTAWTDAQRSTCRNYNIIINYCIMSVQCSAELLFTCISHVYLIYWLVLHPVNSSDNQRAITDRQTRRQTDRDRHTQTSRWTGQTFRSTFRQVSQPCGCGKPACWCALPDLCDPASSILLYSQTCTPTISSSSQPITAQLDSR